MLLQLEKLIHLLKVMKEFTLKVLSSGPKSFTFTISVGGSMRVHDLAFLFKGRSKATQDYILVLLSKFELAIPYDGTHLLIPSLLPTLDQVSLSLSIKKCKFIAVWI